MLNTQMSFGDLKYMGTMDHTSNPFMTTHLDLGEQRNPRSKSKIDNIIQG